jgi:predicted  nucleic acid-binding Zn-ribbon protein
MRGINGLTKEYNNLFGAIEKINKETQERLQALERERITNIRLMKMKTDEERKSFLREIEKEEENKRNREKKIHELTVKIKKIMGSIAKESKVLNYLNNYIIYLLVSNFNLIFRMLMRRNLLWIHLNL